MHPAPPAGNSRRSDVGIFAGTVTTPAIVDD